VTAFHVRQILARPAMPASGHLRTYRPGDQLAVAIQPVRRGAVLTLSGELDVAVAAGFGVGVDTVIAQGLVRLVLDLSALDFYDCSGLTALLRARRSATERHGWVQLARVPPRPARFIRIAGLSGAFPCYPGIDDAFNGTQVPTPDAAWTRHDDVSRGPAATRSPSPYPRPAWPGPHGQR
jgi:anti-sigma B factor antagonist